ncbi:glycosyltransferase [Pseudarthrobacter sp. TAF60_1]|uniref:glycosyltransferase n=1 Tax=Pseudarthrobacter sp. TAF60_1 TaxID=3233071 RepID=UPI003F985551
MSVTIGLPYTDQCGYLGLAIRSVLAQSHADWELILMGDGPDQETREIAHQYTDSRIRFYENDTRIGLAATLNQISKLARFPLIARMDGDDIMHPDRIAIQKNTFDEMPFLDVLGTHAYLIDGDSQLAGLYKEPALPEVGAGYLRSNAFTHPTVMAKKEWFLANPYDEDLLRGEDKELWLRTWEYSNFAKIPDRLMYYRRPRVISAARMQRDEAYNRLIVDKYSTGDSKPLSRSIRLAGSQIKQQVLGAIGKLGLSQLFFSTKWLKIDSTEYSAAQKILDQLMSEKVQVPVASRAIAATVTYANRYPLVERTVKAAFAAGAAQVIVIDNGSEEPTQTRLQELALNDERVNLVRLQENLGSAEGFASAIRAFLQTTEEDYLWLLDDDNECDPGALDNLMQEEMTLRHSSPRGPVAVCAVRPSSPSHAAVANGLPPACIYPPKGSFMYFDLWQRVRSKLPASISDLGGPAAHIIVPYAPYGGLFTSRRSLEIVGLPNTALGLYEDDTEYTARFVSMGGRVALCPGAVVNDIDAKWSESNGHSGLAGLLHATESNRTFFAVRNRVIFDKNNCAGVLDNARFRLNSSIFHIALWGMAIRLGKTAQAQQITAAIAVGAKGDLTKAFT